MEQARIVGITDLSPYRHWLEQAMAKDTGGGTYEDLVAGVEDGSLKALAMNGRAAVVMSLQTQPDRHLHLWALAGERMEEWLDELHAVLQKVAAEQHCTRITCSGRAGWQRALKHLGWRPVSATFEVKVNL